jgi:hypothetical protein
VCDFGDITPDYPLRMGLKDISVALDLGAEVGAPSSVGSTARVFHTRPFVRPRESGLQGYVAATRGYRTNCDDLGIENLKCRVCLVFHQPCG